MPFWQLPDEAPNLVTIHGSLRDVGGCAPLLDDAHDELMCRGGPNTVEIGIDEAAPHIGHRIVSPLHPGPARIEPSQRLLNGILGRRTVAASE